jgi:fatty acid desaturase
MPAFMLPNDRRVMRAAEAETATAQSFLGVAPSFFAGVRSSREKRRIDFVTLGVAIAVYGAFVALTLLFNSLPLWFAAPLGSLLLAWHGSLQHETIHGHPTSSRRVNRLLGGVPLALWIPYSIYRETHLRHHRHEGRYLTHVDRDPESFYLRPGTLAAAGVIRRFIHRANCTFAGRMTIGPAIAIGTFWLSEVRKLRAGDTRHRLVWSVHLLWIAAVLAWVAGVCHISLLVYVAFVVYPGVSVSQLRSFAEHRADGNPRGRTRVVETNPLWSLIFMNNNLHIAHHAHPRLPWHQLPQAWRRMRGAVTDPDLVVRGGYAEVVRNYLLQPLITPEHPGRDESL